MMESLGAPGKGPLAANCLRLFSHGSIFRRKTAPHHARPAQRGERIPTFSLPEVPPHVPFRLSPTLPPPAPLDLDAQLAAAVAARNLDRVIELGFSRYSRRLERFARRAGIRKDDIDDFVDDVFALVVERWPQFRGEAFGAWLQTLAYFTSRTRRKSRRRDRLVPDAGIEDAPAAFCGIEAQLDSRRAVRIALDLVMGLDPSDQFIFTARLHTGADTDISDSLFRELGVVLTPHAVAVRWGRIRDKLVDAIRSRELR